ncbi:dihydropteroate synthase [Halopenitus persicus]|uniref:dihydropteroate synthase n=1 Tax=Halopenitus persicus TaxID=1048396 RepID=A0A1H3ERL0_9EURY|nr:dihydropteroate synthase [Halopenitus persicus]SDX81255.1 dihydropteroate synthase [Halopenitus persicus]
MEYYEAVAALEGLPNLRPDLGTDATASLLERLGDPHEAVPAVQVAGSNGKGSTARVLARILREAGADVGLYTSPDLNDLRDRIRVNGRRIPEREVTRFVAEKWPDAVAAAPDGAEPTFFEAFTGLALWHFARRDVDVAVLEVGIGGRYDATSVVDPVAAAVTSVSHEHTDVLGEDLPTIARDLAQVAPADAPLVTGATGDALAAIREVTDVVTVGANDGTDAETVDVRVAETATSARRPPASVVSIDGSDLDAVDGVGLDAGDEPPLDRRALDVRTRTQLIGSHQAVNAGIAATLAVQVGRETARAGLEPTVADVAAGIRNTTIPGRFEVFDDEPLVVLDGAHNPAACATVADTLDRFDYEDLHLVLGAVREKDHVGMVRSLPDADRIHLAAPAVDRAADVGALEAAIEATLGSQREVGPDAAVDATAAACASVDADAAVGALDTVERHGSVLDAVERAIAAADPGDCVLVTGSLYVVAEARDRWTRAPRVVRADVPDRARSVMRSANVPKPARERHADRFSGVTVRFHARLETARELADAMEDCGGTGVVSGLDAPDRHVEVVLSGTRARFRTLLGRLRESSPADRRLASAIATAVERERTAVDRGRTAVDGIESDRNGKERTETGDHDVDETGTNDVDETGTNAADAPPWRDGTAVMGILNVTPDSFHDGGDHHAVEAAAERGRELVAAGADVLDVGGESTRPGADPVPAAVERERVVPVIERLAELDVAISVDTRKPSVARAALGAGADVVNDVTGLADARMRAVVADAGCPVVVMHSLSAPVDPAERYPYDDVVDDVFDALRERLLLAERAGIDREDVIVDPGLGFGKRPAESFELLDRIGEFRALGTPVLVGHSHKSMFDAVEPETGPVAADAADRNDSDRLAATIAATALAAERGVDLVRVHDVAENVAAVGTAAATAASVGANADRDADGSSADRDADGSSADRDADGSSADRDADGANARPDDVP